MKNRWLFAFISNAIRRFSVIIFIILRLFLLSGRCVCVRRFISPCDDQIQFNANKFDRHAWARNNYVTAEHFLCEINQMRKGKRQRKRDRFQPKSAPKSHGHKRLNGTKRAYSDPNRNTFSLNGLNKFYICECRDLTNDKKKEEHIRFLHRLLLE